MSLKMTEIPGLGGGAETGLPFSTIGTVTGGVSLNCAKWALGGRLFLPSGRGGRAEVNFNEKQKYFN